ncbi:glycosyltransferase [Thermomonas brevis]
MRLLLIAYEFPPSPSPQSLRWTYLARELAGRGHDVHVLTIDLGGDTPGLPELPDAVTVHRTFAGPFRGLFAARRKQLARRQANAAAAPTATAAPPSRQGWKHRLSERVQALLADALFPDARGEWLPWGRARLLRLLDALDPDIVVSSHEPATTLQLGLLAKARGYPWIADLGDPVLAGYTPARWRRRAGRLEARVCRDADTLLVTTDGARALMASRHGRVDGVHIVSQGYDASAEVADIAAPATMDRARIELLYTGSLYRFRRIDELLRALERMPEARLNIASISLPDELLAWAARFPDRIRVLGFLPHRQVLRLQRDADVLVNIANEDPRQIPGKVYEYLGARRPILHLGNPQDAISGLLQRTGRGMACANDADAIVRCLRAAWPGLRQPLPEDATDEAANHSWQALAARVDALARDLAKPR